jgi:hypothetical protein
MCRIVIAILALVTLAAFAIEIYALEMQHFGAAALMGLATGIAGMITLASLEKGCTSEQLGDRYKYPEDATDQPVHDPSLDEHA